MEIKIPQTKNEAFAQLDEINHWDGSGDLQQFLETSTWFQIYEV